MFAKPLQHMLCVWVGVGVVGGGGGRGPDIVGAIVTEPAKPKHNPTQCNFGAFGWVGVGRLECVG